MEIHIILSILLDYCTSIKQWSTARCLNRISKEIVDSKKYDTTCWGRRTFISTVECEICRHKFPTVGAINYFSGDFISMLHITHCSHWFCKISAIRSMLEHCKQNNICRLREPFQNSNNVDIPRSNGSVSKGFCNTEYLIKRDKCLVYTYWNDESYQYTKLIPLTHYTSNEPKLLFEMS